MKQVFYLFLILCSDHVRFSLGLNNGLARTPPMGWLSWERFGCEQDCDVDPDNCIGERLLRRMADAMVSEGFRDVGYEYITVDDCWLADRRDSRGRVQPDVVRFPNGMKNLSHYIHSKGLKLGVYADVGTHTCAGFPGSQGYYEIDAQTFADWGIDMVKFDGCNADVGGLNYGYPTMGYYLNRTGRPILYSCEWPIYLRPVGVKPNYTAVAETCNIFRVYGDIYDSFQSIRSITSWYGNNEGDFASVAGPGNFNDPDELVVGDFGLSRDEERVQMGLWAMFAAPLLVSADLAKMNPVSKALLQHRGVLSINQDPLGIQGRRVINLYNQNFQIWTRPIVPNGSFAVAAIYFVMHGHPVHVAIPLREIGLNATGGYNITEVFDGKYVGAFKPNQNFTFVVDPSGIYLLKALLL